MATNMNWAWANGHSRGLPANEAGEELERIRLQRGNGVLRPSDVVDESRPEEAVLHEEFTWDDYEAAERWRREEARGIIRTVRVIPQDDVGSDNPVKVIPFVHVPNVHQEQNYRPVGEVLRCEDMRAAVLNSVQAQLNGLRSRYQQFSELDHVWQAIEEAAAQRAAELARAAAEAKARAAQAANAAATGAATSQQQPPSDGKPITKITRVRVDSACDAAPKADGAPVR